MLHLQGRTKMGSTCVGGYISVLPPEHGSRVVVPSRTLGLGSPARACLRLGLRADVRPVDL